MKSLLRVFPWLHGLLALLFAAAALMLVAVAVHLGWEALSDGLTHSAAQRVIEVLGVLAAAVVALQIAQTITEEEVVREAHVGGPTRLRRFLSRFLVVIVVALAIESLVATFRAAHEGASQLLYAALMVAAIGVLLWGWGGFIRHNRSVEEMEPEAMQEAKSEDHKLKQPG
jgi:hypothetical protein